MRILHTSDWHLGRQFHHVSLLPDQAYVLQQLTEIAIEENVDAVIVAGDIYDRAVPPAAAVSLLDQVLDKVCREQGIPVIMVPGNHDSADRLGFAARQLAETGLHIIDQPEMILTPVILEDESGPLAVYGIPYLEPARARQFYQLDLAGHDEVMAHVTARISAHRQDHDSWRSVVVSHCFLAGGEVSESERPLSVGGAEQVSASHFKAFDYTALGHLHAAQSRGANNIRYSGSIMKYSFSEEHHLKSVTLVDLNASGACAVEQRLLHPLHELRTLEGMLEELLEKGKEDSAAEDYLQVRLGDRHAILDVMGKLREIYPNVLHLERPGLQTSDSGQQARRARLKQGEFSMFEDFYRQVQGQEMDAEQRELVGRTIDRIHREEA